MPTRDPYRSPANGAGFSLNDGAFPTTSSSSQSRILSPSMAQLASPASSVVSSGAGSFVSTSSSYRHHQAAFMPQQTPASPRPVLINDANHQPKTLGSVGIMIVGLGGANGTTLLAGILANRLKIQWRGARGEEMTPNYFGCITQITQRGRYGGVGYKDKIKGLADVSMAAVGGWVSTFFLSCLLNVQISLRNRSHPFVALVWRVSIGYSSK
jgi:hypothetical protein